MVVSLEVVVTATEGGNSTNGESRVHPTNEVNSLSRGIPVRPHTVRARRPSSSVLHLLLLEISCISPHVWASEDFPQNT